VAVACRPPFLPRQPSHRFFQLAPSGQARKYSEFRVRRAVTIADLVLPALQDEPGLGHKTVTDYEQSKSGQVSK